VLDPDPEVRRHLHEIVRDHADPALFDAVVRSLKEDASWRMRAGMVDLLLAGGRASARAPLLAALDDPHVAVRARADEALERLTGRAYGTVTERWTQYFKEQAEAERPRKDTGETVSVADAHRKVELHKGPIRGLQPTLYTIPIREKRVIFVVDMSSSMAKGVRSEHFQRLREALFGLASDVEFNILCFDQRMFFFAKAKSLVPATNENKDGATRWIDELPAGERTDVHRSVASGLAMLKEALAADPDARAELFILTDGRETVTSMSAEAIENQYRKLPVERCRVHVVSLGRNGTPALARLAAASGGVFKEASGR